jgi:NAD(P)H-dependent FMN reductase
MRHVFVINGSASEGSTNHLLIQAIEKLARDRLTFTIFSGLKLLPHFDPALTLEHTPKPILDLRKRIEKADGLLICTPEYVMSIPSGLKNAIEWCVSTNVFFEKPTGLITASTMGKMGHKQLQLIMETASARLTKQAILLIPGIKSKFNDRGELNDKETLRKLVSFIATFDDLISKR